MKNFLPMFAGQGNKFLVLKVKKKKRKKRLPRIVGRREFVDFPALNMNNIEAKIDTGAYTCALHCHDISEKEIGGKKVLCFYLLDPSHEEYHKTEHVFFDFTRKKIKSSSGEYEERYIIKTIVRLGRRRIRTTISLTDRGHMRCPVLVGRKLLRGKFIVDVSRIHTNGILFRKAFETGK
jgi:hypothetical protein